MSYIKQRNVFVVFVLSLVTCGIYGIYLFFAFASELKRETTRQNVGIELADPVIALLLSIVTCGIYGIYYIYKQALAIELVGKKYNYIATSPIVVLIFTLLFGIGAYFNIYGASEVAKRIEVTTINL